MSLTSPRGHLRQPHVSAVASGYLTSRRSPPAQIAAGKAEQTFLGKGSHGTEGSKMGAHIDHSKDINKMGNIVGDMGNLGFDGTTTLLGTGSQIGRASCRERV